MKTNRRLTFIIAMLGAAAAAAMTGCGTNPAPTSIVCTDFRVGADFSSETFGVTGDLQRPYGALAQAAGDLAAVANELVRAVGASCQALAVELGADPADPRVVGKLEPDAVRAWCKVAAERFTSVRPQLAVAHFGVQVVTPKCTVDTSFELACEHKCLANAACTEAPPAERCPAEAREGICPGICVGACTGSMVAPAGCAGKCDGTCFGTCGGDEDSVACETGCDCTKACKGTCSGACDQPPEGHCDALCSGHCSEPMLAQACTAPLELPKCAGDADCQKSCRTSGDARAACPAGSLAVVIDPAALADPRTAQVVGALERNLPAIFLASRGRAKVLADGATALLDSAGHILSRGGELGPMGVACGMLIGETGSEAQKNLNAALAGSKELTNAISGDGVGP